MPVLFINGGINVLLAKSYNDKFEKYHTLIGHTECVLNSGNELFNVVQHHLSLFGIDEQHFYNLLKLSLICHDLGKANDHFQDAVRDNNIKQGIRHEWISLLIFKKFYN